MEQSCSAVSVSVLNPCFVENSSTKDNSEGDEWLAPCGLDLCFQQTWFESIGASCLACVCSLRLSQHFFLCHLQRFALSPYWDFSKSVHQLAPD